MYHRLIQKIAVFQFRICALGLYASQQAFNAELISSLNGFRVDPKSAYYWFIDQNFQTRLLMTGLLSKNKNNIFLKIYSMFYFDCRNPILSCLVRSNESSSETQVSSIYFRGFFEISLWIFWSKTGLPKSVYNSGFLQLFIIKDSVLYPCITKDN